MRKIPTLFERDPHDRRHVTAEVTPGCEWVLAGEGTPTRKYDGTCVLIRRDGLAVKAFARREVKPGKTPPPNWVEVDHDEVTGKRMGWEPGSQSGFAGPLTEALAVSLARHPAGPMPGTYELCGPKINRNPEGYTDHVLVPHGAAVINPPRDLSWASLRELLLSDEYEGVEGIVWHHPDGRMAKLKRRDFPT